MYICLTLSSERAKGKDIPVAMSTLSAPILVSYLSPLKEPGLREMTDSRVRIGKVNVLLCQKVRKS